MTGADPAELDRAARDGPAQAWTLDHAARGLDHLDGVRRWRGGRHLALVAEVVTGLRRLGERFAALDAWVEQVAAALRDADTPTAALPLLELGVEHPASHLVTAGAVRWQELRPGLLDDHRLDALAATARLPAPVRDRVQRERLARWVSRLDDRVAAVPEAPGWSPLDRLATWVDQRLLELLAPVVDLHDSPAEQTARLRAEVDGVRRVLAEPGLAVLSFDPGGPSVRIALGDVDTAGRLVVLLPGTATGLHAIDEPLVDATALHRLLQHDTAVVLDLYAAPSDLGRAADRVPGRDAGAATAAFLAALPPSTRRVTLVGHSYGAFTAAHAARVAPSGTVDALVLLGAPGVGVATTAELPVPEVWADRAPGDPIGVVADLDEHLRRLPPGWVPAPLTDPLAGLGPDPTDPEFGARPLSALPAGGEVLRGHLDYLTAGTATLQRVATVVSGTLPTPDRPTSAGGA